MITLITAAGRMSPVYLVFEWLPFNVLAGILPGHNLDMVINPFK